MASITNRHYQSQHNTALVHDTKSPRWHHQTIVVTLFAQMVNTAKSLTANHLELNDSRGISFSVASPSASQSAVSQFTVFSQPRPSQNSLLNDLKFHLVKIANPASQFSTLPGTWGDLLQFRHSWQAATCPH